MVHLVLVDLLLLLVFFVLEGKLPQVHSVLVVLVLIEQVSGLKFATFDLVHVVVVHDLELLPVDLSWGRGENKRKLNIYFCS